MICIRSKQSLVTLDALNMTIRMYKTNLYAHIYFYGRICAREMNKGV